MVASVLCERVSQAFRGFRGVVVGIVSCVLLLVGGVSPVFGVDAGEETPVVGSFNVGGSLSLGVDERSGGLGLQIPVGGLVGLDMGVELGVSYHHNNAVVNGDVFGLGSGWGWDVSHVETDGGVRVFPASGGVFVADASWASGLVGYKTKDLVFRQESGVLDGISYAFSLEYPGGKDFFSSAGDVAARFDVFGHRTVWSWGVGHRLLKVTDDVGDVLTVGWSESGVEIVAPSRGDGVISKTLLGIAGSRLMSITDPVGQRVDFKYESKGLLEGVISSSGAVTEVSYQDVPVVGGVLSVVNCVRVIDSNSGEQLSSRTWSVLGEHNSSGYPMYAGEEALFGSGDGKYEYETVLSDGPTKVVSHFSSLGLLVSREVKVSGGVGDGIVREQRLEYPVGEGELPPQYSKPTRMSQVFHDGRGGSREVVENFVFDEIGRIVTHTDPEGVVSEVVYDTHVPVVDERLIPGGVSLPVGLVSQQTVTALDGTVSKTVNTPAGDSRSIAVTETFTGTTGSELTCVSRGEKVFDGDGFVVQERVVSPQKSNVSGPLEVLSQFSRVVDGGAKTVSVKKSVGVGTSSEVSSVTVSDVVSGLVVSTVDVVGRETFSVYDEAGRVVLYRDAQGRETRSVYGTGVTRVTGPDGFTSSEYVDVLGRVVKTTDNVMVGDGGRVVFVSEFERTVQKRQYEQNGSKVVMTDGLGVSSSSRSDVFGRVREVVSPTGVREVREYDDVQNTVTSGMTTDSSGGFGGAPVVSVVKHDVSGRAVQQGGKRLDGVVVPESSTVFDGLGRMTGQVAGDVSSRRVLNADGTARSTTSTSTKEGVKESVRADREFSPFGESVHKTLTDQSGDSRVGVCDVLDVLGRTVKEVDQAGGVVEYVYTPDGLVSERTHKSSGVVTHNTYDLKTRALILTETFGGDGEVSRTGFEYDSAGRVVGVFDPENREDTLVTYSYDVLGDQVGMRYPDGGTLTHVFDEWGRKVSSVDVVGNVTRFEYDRVGFLVQVSQTDRDGVVVGRVGYVYDPYGRVTTQTVGDGVKTRYTYSSTNRVRSEVTTDGVGGVVLDAQYVYDSHDNVIQKNEARQQPGLGVVSQTIFYGYDGFNRLVSSATYDGSIKDISDEKVMENLVSRTAYEVNVSGDVTRQVTTAPGSSEVREFEYNGLGQLAAVTTGGVRRTQEYDAVGNLVRGVDGTEYAYNVYNQVVQETHSDGFRVENTYWVTGKRRSSSTFGVEGSVQPGGGNTVAGGNTIPGGSTVTGSTVPVSEFAGLYWDGDTLVNDSHTRDETSLSGGIPDVVGERTVTAGYLFGVSRHVRTLSEGSSGDTGVGVRNIGDTVYYVSDRHGSITHVTDEQGRALVGYMYTDYGNATMVCDPLVLTRQAGGFERFGFDNPFQYAGEYTTSGGKQLLGARVYDPTQMRFTTKDSAPLYNLYAYANANPITMVDPTGNSAADDFASQGGAASVGLLVSIIGLVLSAVTLHIGSLLATSTTSLFDYGVAAAQFTGYLKDERAKMWGWISFGVGLATGLFATGWAAWKFFRPKNKGGSIVSSVTGAAGNEPVINKNSVSGLVDAEEVPHTSSSSDSLLEDADHYATLTEALIPEASEKVKMIKAGARSLDVRAKCLQQFADSWLPHNSQLATDARGALYSTDLATRTVKSADESLTAIEDYAKEARKSVQKNDLEGARSHYGHAKKEADGINWKHDWLKDKRSEMKEVWEREWEDFEWYEREKAAF